MSFDNPIFVLLLIASMLVIRIPSPLAGWGLLAASVFFYSFSGAFEFTLFAIIIVVNWIAANFVARFRSVFWLAIAGNIAILVFFKYREMLLPTAMTSNYARIAIPLGISFYLFHIMAYLSDLRMKRARLVGLHKFALFVGFFPHLIAGPIVRAKQLMPQLAPLWAGLPTRRHLAFFGLALCTLGLVKKIVFANSLAPVVDNLFFTLPADTLVAWMGAWLFGFQIYFDFSGYTDIALGSAMLLGLRLPTNFRSPYLAADPREFWQRWHITLSAWIRDYLYIPLGGHEGGPARRAAVLVGVMALAGLWHGANWTFVTWGTLWGAYILAWRYASPFLAGIPRWLRWCFHIVVVMVLWVFFRAPDIAFACQYIGTMFSFSFQKIPAYDLAIGVIGCAMLMGAHWIENLTQQRHVIIVMRRLNHPIVVGLLVGICLLLLLFPRYDASPFIYFRF